MTTARQDMVIAAERLFAERGLHGVSMREVVAAADQRNNSAIQYHFGGRDGLVRAVFAYRMRDINAARWTLLGRLDADGLGHDVRSLMRAYVEPLVAFLDSAQDGRYYAQFLASAVPFTDFTDPELSEVTDAVAEVALRLIAALTHLPPDTATVRVAMMFTMMPSSLAVHEQRQLAGLPQLHAGFAELATDLVDIGAGALLAAHTSNVTP